MSLQDAFIPYCGVAPTPAEIWAKWNLDPILSGALVAMALLYWRGARRARLTPLRTGSFAAGWGLLVLAFVSPLCNLGVALFSARSVQHAIVLAAALPLVICGKPSAMLELAPRWLRAPLGALYRHRPGAVVSTMLFAGLLWIWHAPFAYDATLQNNMVYWSMHLSMIGAGLLLWSHLAVGLPDAGKAVVAGLATSLQMGLLGALLTLGPRALYSVHASTTWPWGLSQIADQQLGGLIIWVPGCTVFLAAGIIGMANWLRQLDLAHPASVVARR